ncbi:MAG TPA: S53 family peptidase [Candidatus Aquilonibacter sp.]|nr:S53 family peptidase [Candidatus Aquilonibacter sp.]
MRVHSRATLSAFAILALAACGGGSNGTVPSAATQPQTMQNTPADAGMYAAFPSAAPAGVRIYVHLPLRNSDALDALIAAQSDKNSPQYHQFLTPAQFRAQFGPTAGDLRSAASSLASQGFKTTITSQGIVADAPQSVVERTFNVHLSRRTVMSAVRGAAPAVLMQADRAPQLPQALQNVHAQVAAFAPLPAMRPQSMRVSASPIADNRYGADGPYWMTDLKQAYQYPSYTTANGRGRTIAILAASDFLDSDVALYFGHEHLTPPMVSRRPVDGGSPAFNINSGLSDEVSLDVQQAGGSAPGAHIVVYEAPDASIVPSFLDMYTAIVDDNVADVSSASFGLCELYFTAAYNNGQDFTSLFQTFHDVFRQGNAQGITFVNSSGDNGALGCTDVSGATATYGVEWPANDPDNTAVGGTNLVTTYVPGSRHSAYVSQNAYADRFAANSGEPAGALWGSGGGKSTYWKKPFFQRLVPTGSDMRTVPDVAMHMGGCPYGAVTPCGKDRSADVTALGGALYLLIGTSASAPEFAGLQAIQDEVLGGRAGNANYLIYALDAIGGDSIFRDDIPGDNGYKTKDRYNYVLGVGTPRGAAYALDPFGPDAGDPLTASNP